MRVGAHELVFAHAFGCVLRDGACRLILPVVLVGRGRDPVALVFDRRCGRLVGLPTACSAGEARQCLELRKHRSASPLEQSEDTIRRRGCPGRYFFQEVTFQPLWLMSKMMPFGVLELALETFLILFAEVEEELAAGAFDGLLLPSGRRPGTRVMDADERLWVLQAGTDLALILQQREIDLAIAHVDAPRRRPFGDLGAPSPNAF